jgi:alpha-N-arabinofuranosidase
MRNSSRLFFPQAFALIPAIPSILFAQIPAPAELRIHADQVTAHVSPLLYGLMTEEINYSYDGGLYGELIRNRNFKEDAKDPVHWQVVDKGAAGTISLDSANPLNGANTVSLKLTAEKVAANQTVGVANDGFWGIPVSPRTTYRASLWAKAAPGFTGPLNLAIVSNYGAVVHAKATILHLTTEWRKYEATLTTHDAAVSAQNRFVISLTAPGSVWLNMVSLFPPTYNNRPNGNRKDIMELLAGMKPAFLRFPGGNYLEGNTVATRFDWKKTLGDNSARPGHMDDAWRYWSSDGMGLLEFLEWCEDLHMEPVLGVYAGYSLRGGARFKPGPDLQPYIKEALEEIEYVTGGPNTAWGTRRAKDGHPAAFHLQYVEIGNEDGGDRETGSYEGRFAQFFDAIRAQYPDLKIIATTPVTTRAADVIDEHYYRRSEDEMAYHANDYDVRRRLGPPVFVGEWATRVGDPTPTLGAALADAAWMIGMERNSDLVIMASYAPLFVNVNKGGMQWPTDLIGYDTLSSYGSPTYYAQKMFSTCHGDEVLATSAQSVPSREWQPLAGRGGRGPATATPQQTPMPQQAPLMFFDATRDSRTGTVYVKVVNRAATAYPVHINVAGIAAIEPSGEVLIMKGDGPQDTNSIQNPEKIKPVTVRWDGLSTDFTHTFPPYSVTVLQMKGK